MFLFSHNRVQMLNTNKFLRDIYSNALCKNREVNKSGMSETDVSGDG